MSYQSNLTIDENSVASYENGRMTFRKKTSEEMEQRKQEIEERKREVEERKIEIEERKRENQERKRENELCIIAQKQEIEERKRKNEERKRENELHIIARKQEIDKKQKEIELKRSENNSPQVFTIDGKYSKNGTGQPLFNKLIMTEDSTWNFNGNNVSPLNFDEDMKKIGYIKSDN